MVPGVLLDTAWSVSRMLPCVVLYPSWCAVVFHIAQCMDLAVLFSVVLGVTKERSKTRLPHLRFGSQEEAKSSDGEYSAKPHILVEAR